MVAIELREQLDGRGRRDAANGQQLLRDKCASSAVHAIVTLAVVVDKRPAAIDLRPQVSFVGNVARDGGAVMFMGGDMNLMQSTIRANVASGSGGGVHFVVRRRSVAVAAAARSLPCGERRNPCAPSDGAGRRGCQLQHGRRVRQCRLHARRRCGSHGGESSFSSRHAGRGPVCDRLSKQAQVLYMSGCNFTNNSAQTVRCQR